MALSHDPGSDDDAGVLAELSPASLYLLDVSQRTPVGRPLHAAAPNPFLVDGRYLPRGGSLWWRTHVGRLLGEDVSFAIVHNAVVMAFGELRFASDHRPMILSRRQLRSVRRRLHPANWRWALGSDVQPGVDVYPGWRYFYIVRDPTSSHCFIRRIRRSPRCVEFYEGGRYFSTFNRLARCQYRKYVTPRARLAWDNRHSDLGRWVRSKTLKRSLVNAIREFACFQCLE